MEKGSLLEPLISALEAGDLPAARAAATHLRESGAGKLQLAAEVLHELKQPLLGLKAYTQMMMEAGPPSGSPVRLMLSQVERMEHIIADFTRLAAEKPAPQQKVNLCSHVRAAERLFHLNPDSARVTLEVDAPEQIELQGNGRLLEQMVLNLMNNARDAMSGLGRIAVQVSREADRPVIHVADWGPGIPTELRSRLFEPYVTTKTRGTGLGLSVCKRIAQEHKAEISLAPSDSLHRTPPPATVFKITFPALAAAVAPRRKLLVVDDEAVIRRVFHDLMTKECDVVEAATAEEALEQLAHTPFDLIVTDKNLPGLSGLDLAQQARALNPNSKVILMTGYPSLVTAQQGLELGLIDYLLKPFDEIREVRAKLRAALEAPVPGHFVATNKRIDVYEDDGESAKRIAEALSMLGLEPNLMHEAVPVESAPAGVVVSWSFGPARGKEAVRVGRAASRGAPFVVLAEHLTMEIALDCLRGGAAACLPKLTSDVKALSRELTRALRL